MARGRKGGLFSKLYDGKGYEWYHILLVAIIVGAIMYLYGQSSVDVSQNCDTIVIEISQHEFIPTNVKAHSCDTIQWVNNENDDNKIVDKGGSFESDWFSKRETFEVTNLELGKYVYHSEKNPAIMIGTIEVS